MSELIQEEMLSPTVKAGSVATSPERIRLRMSTNQEGLSSEEVLGVLADPRVQGEVVVSQSASSVKTPEKKGVIYSPGYAKTHGGDGTLCVSGLPIQIKVQSTKSESLMKIVFLADKHRGIQYNRREKKTGRGLSFSDENESSPAPSPSPPSPPSPPAPKDLPAESVDAQESLFPTEEVVLETSKSLTAGKLSHRDKRDGILGLTGKTAAACVADVYGALTADAPLKKIINLANEHSATYDWMHLIAFRFLGKESQSTDNLVIGTRACNIVMEVIEDSLAQWLIQNPTLSLDLTVKAFGRKEYGKNFATRIEMDIRNAEKLLTFRFYNFSTEILPKGFGASVTRLTKFFLDKGVDDNLKRDIKALQEAQVTSAPHSPDGELPGRSSSPPVEIKSSVPNPVLTASSESHQSISFFGHRDPQKVISGSPSGIPQEDPKQVSEPSTKKTRVGR